jgi:hypothetical protein
MSQTEQNYKNHARWLAPFHFFVLPVLLVYVLNSLRHAVLSPSLSTGFVFLVSVALLTTAFLTRTQALKAQDRVIRLEMRLRLREVLPPDLHPRIIELTPEQMIGLRFASDAELPELVRQALAGTLTTTKSIKEAVKDWQADHLRV